MLHELKHTFTAFGSITTISAGTHCTATQKKSKTTAPFSPSRSSFHGMTGSLPLWNKKLNVLTQHTGAKHRSILSALSSDGAERRWKLSHTNINCRESRQKALIRFILYLRTHDRQQCFQQKKASHLKDLPCIQVSRTKITHYPTSNKAFFSIFP